MKASLLLLSPILSTHMLCDSESSLRTDQLVLKLSAYLYFLNWTINSLRTEVTSYLSCIWIFSLVWPLVSVQ